MRNTKIQWYRIPVGLGIGFLGLVQFYKVSSREKERLENEDGQEGSRAPKKRARIRPDGPWYVTLIIYAPIPMSMLTQPQASPGHVNSTPKGYL
jgi:phosphatidylserine decarboxylase